MKDADIEIGARVRVAIADRRRYASGSSVALDGKVGTVEEVNVRVPPRQYLVRFDSPARAWWRGQSPASAWWFDADDLEPLS